MIGEQRIRALRLLRTIGRLSLEETAKIIGVTRERIRQLEEIDMKNNPNPSFIAADYVIVERFFSSCLADSYADVEKAAGRVVNTNELISSARRRIGEVDGF